MPSDQAFAFYLYPTDESKVKQTILQLDDNFFCGIDNLSNVLVKVTEYITTSYLLETVEISFQKGCLQNQLCKAKVVPLQKSSSRIEENDYSPISLPVVWSQTFERVMFNKVYY